MFTRQKIISAFKHGIAGFIVFLSIIVIAKLLNHMIFGGDKLFIESKDLLLALLGFFYLVFVKSIEDYNAARNHHFQNKN